MANEPLTIPVDPASKLGRALAEADAPVVLDVNGARYTVDREHVFAHDDANAVLHGLRQSRGALQGVDTEALLADLAEQRRQDPTRRPV
ncbi:MAG: hypothetical protein M3464_03650 [Chloroflexota bacterium]|nr:hypothetical protein [Chloroflexota bacterium]